MGGLILRAVLSHNALGEAGVVSERILTPDLIAWAYSNGWFPMADEHGAMAWYQPQNRALFPISGIHVSHSLARTLRRSEFEIRFDTAFEEVIRSCRRPDGNWINEEIVQAYTEVSRQGWAHCAECWFEGELVGGIYGVAIGGCFSAESMFHRRTDASKVALYHMVEKCRDLGFEIFDAQVMNPHLERMGAYKISIGEYLERLALVLEKPTAWSRQAITPIPR